MSRESRMGAEVGNIQAKIGREIGCSTCGIGLALDIVARRWDRPDVIDWRGQSFGHKCRVSVNGLSQEQIAKVEAIAATLNTFGATQRDGASEQRSFVAPQTRAPIAPDPRLPPERDTKEPGADDEPATAPAASGPTVYTGEEALPF